MQDASFIALDPGHAKKYTHHGDESKTSRNRDGIWSKKGTKSYFGYKMHDAIDEDHGLIRRIEVISELISKSHGSPNNQE